MCQQKANMVAEMTAPILLKNLNMLSITFILKIVPALACAINKPPTDQIQAVYLCLWGVSWFPFS